MEPAKTSRARARRGAEVQLIRANPATKSTELAHGRKLTAKAVATRTRIIEQATEAFAAEGYAAVTVRGIAESAGVSSGAIYATFRGKAELLVEAVRTSIASDWEDNIPAEIATRPVAEVDAYQFATASTPRRQRLRKLLIEAAVAARTDPEIATAVGVILRGRIGVWADEHAKWPSKTTASHGIDFQALTMLLISIDLGLGILAALGAETPTPDQLVALIEPLLRTLA